MAVAVLWFSINYAGKTFCVLSLYGTIFWNKEARNIIIKKTSPRLLTKVRCWDAAGTADTLQQYVIGSSRIAD